MKLRHTSATYCRIYIINLLISITSYASQYGPGLYLFKPAYTDPYLHSFTLAFASGQASQAYNEHGQVVPFLQQYGTEDFLKRFIDPELPVTDTQVIGQVDFSGIFNLQRCNIMYYKNIHHNLFMGIGTILQNLTIDSISADINITDNSVTIDSNDFQHFHSQIPSRLNSAGMYLTYIEVGYNNKFTHFQGIDYLQMQVTGLFCTPQYMNHTDFALLQYPLSGNITFCYPIFLNLLAGINKHLNLGFFGLIIPLQPVQLECAVNNSNTNNHILLSEKTQVMMYPKPAFAGNFYIELTSPSSQFTGTLGFGYAYGMEWNISALDQQNYNDELLNLDRTFDAWSIVSCVLEMNYISKNPRAPHLSLYYVFPIAGSFFPKLNLIGGSYNLLCSYEF